MKQVQCMQKISTFLQYLQEYDCKLHAEKGLVVLRLLVWFGSTNAIIKRPKNELSSSVINCGCIGLAIEGIEKQAVKPQAAEEEEPPAMMVEVVRVRHHHHRCPPKD